MTAGPKTPRPRPAPAGTALDAERAERRALPDHLTAAAAVPAAAAYARTRNPHRDRPGEAVMTSSGAASQIGYLARVLKPTARVGWAARHRSAARTGEFFTSNTLLALLSCNGTYLMPAVQTYLNHRVN